MTTNSTDILLVGKTGNGKSATANSLVGYDAFTTTDIPYSETKSVQFEYTDFDGRILKVVDTPGTEDTSFGTEDGVKIFVEAMTVAVTINPDGYHAILIIVRSDVRFTQGEIDTVRLLKDIFGPAFIRDHAILLMTHGERFTQSEDVEKVDQWIRRQQGHIAELIDECCGRVLIFDNETEDIKVKNDQIRKLLKMIDNMAGNGKRYTSDVFKKAIEVRDRYLKESITKQLSPDVVMDCSLIHQQLYRIDYDNPEEAAVLLEDLKNRIEVLEQQIKKQDHGTKSLHVALISVQQTKESISDISMLVYKVHKITLNMKHMQLEIDKIHKAEVTRMPKYRLQVGTEKRNIKQKSDNQRKEAEKLGKQKEEYVKMHRKSVKKNYENVKLDLSRTHSYLASLISGPVLEAVKIRQRKE